MTRRRLGGAGRREHGAVLVEAALGIPIFLLFVFGLVDVGMWSFNVNQATNAARDGARTAILDYEAADIPNSDDWDAVLARMGEHLNRDLDEGQVTIACVDGDGDLVSGGCAAAEPHVHRVRVEVDWEWTFVTPVAGVFGRSEGGATGTSTMEIIGRPDPDSPLYDVDPDDDEDDDDEDDDEEDGDAGDDGDDDPEDPPDPGEDPSDCVVTDWSVAPDPVPTRNNQKLQGSLTVSFATTGSCADLSIALTPPGGDTILHTCPGSSECEWTIDKNGHMGVWFGGEGDVQVINDGYVKVLGHFEVEH